LESDRRVGAHQAFVLPPVFPATLHGAETILVVSDTPLMKVNLAGLFRQLGYKVFEATDSGHAQRIAMRETKIHIFFMDLATIEGQNLELVHWFDTFFPETRILVASNPFGEMNSRLVPFRQVSRIAKPYTALDLAEIVRRILT
jgi:DNA-binding NtrC family response regulator